MLGVVLPRLRFGDGRQLEGGDPETALLVPRKDVADETALLEPEQKRAVEAAIFPGAGEHTDAAMKRAVRAAVLDIDPDLVRRRHQAEKKARDVWCSTAPFGMAKLTAYVTAAEGQQIFGEGADPQLPEPPPAIE